MFQITILGVTRPKHRNALASVQVELTSEDGADVVCILDARVLRNKSDDRLFVAYPENIFKLRGQKAEYDPILKCSRDLQRRISDRVLQAYENHLLFSPQPAKMKPEDFGNDLGGQ